jgi:hypothetical protein
MKKTPSYEIKEKYYTFCLALYEITHALNELLIENSTAIELLSEIQNAIYLLRQEYDL